MAGRLSTRAIRRVNKLTYTTDQMGLGDYLDTMLGGITQIGQVFYCDPTSGSDDWTGKTPDRAKRSSQAAIDLCVANRGDVVVRMRGGEAVTSVVDFNVAGMTYITEGYGMAPLATGEYFSIYSTTLTSDPTAIVTADGVTIAGPAFVGVDAGATFYDGAALLLRASLSGTATAAPFGVRIVNCRFPKWNLANRIGIGIDGASDSIIEHCAFEGVGADFDSGIYMQGATTNIEIIDNRFRDCTYAIQTGTFAGGGPHAFITRNMCEDSKLFSAGPGAAATAGTGLLCNNWCEGATDTGSYNDSVNDLQTAGWTITDNHYAE